MSKITNTGYIANGKKLRKTVFTNREEVEKRLPKAEYGNKEYYDTLIEDVEVKDRHVHFYEFDLTDKSQLKKVFEDMNKMKIEKFRRRFLDDLTDEQIEPIAEVSGDYL